MKVKLKDINKKIPSYSSYYGLDTSDWEKLNAGKVVNLEKIPGLAEPYLEKEKTNGKS